MKYRTVLVTDGFTRKGSVCVHLALPQESTGILGQAPSSHYIVTLNRNKSSTENVIETLPTFAEAAAFARGIWKGIEILS